MTPRARRVQRAHRRYRRWARALTAGGALIVHLIASPRSGAASGCAPANGTSPCIDATSLWLATGAADWFSIPASSAVGPGRIALAIAGQVSVGALRLVAPSPDPAGRVIHVVDRVVEEDVLLAAGLGRGFELGLALPVILHQTGAGSAGITSQSANPIDPAGERDPRVSVGFAPSSAGPLALKPRLEVALPLGNREAYASAGTPTLAPGLAVRYAIERVSLGVDVAARLRESVEFGSVRWGSQGVLSLGVAVDVWHDRRLSFAGEWSLAPSLVGADSERARAAGVHTRLLASEWLASVRVRPQADFSVALGGGGALPLSTQSSTAGEMHFAAPTTPGLRMILEVRYAPER